MRFSATALTILACVFARASHALADGDAATPSAAAPAATSAAGVTYYIDFAGGSDDADGRSPGTAFKHCPGDAESVGKAKAVKLAPGDTVLFKGGVIYRGAINVTASGKAGSPIIYNGNSAGTFGSGRATLDGSEELTGWKPCASADEAAGNPNWKNIYWAPAPKFPSVFTINLCEGNVTLPIAQEPNPVDPFFEDVVSTYRPVLEPQPAPVSGVRVTPVHRMAENPSRKFVLMVDGDAGSSAILDPLVGAEIKFQPAKPATIVAVGLALPDPKYYPPPTEVSFSVDGNEILRAKVEAKGGLQRFALPAAVAMKDLAIKVLAAKDDTKQGYGAIASVEAYDDGNRNVLLGPPKTVYRDANCFTQKDPHAWDGAYFALHGRPNMIYYQRVQGFDPATNTITMDMLTADQYPTKGDTIGRYSMMNALPVLDRPGEFVVDERLRADGTQRVWMWPLAGGEPKGVSYSVRSAGFAITGASYVTIEGFLIRKQGAKPNAYAVSGSLKGATDVTVRDNEMMLIRANRNQVVGINGGNRIRVTGNYIHECRRAGAICLDGCTDSDIDHNRLHKNGATCVLLYRSHNVRVEHNDLTEHKGMHANGLTAYVNSSGITFAYNRVRSGNVALTLQEGADMLVHHNLFDNEGTGSPVGLWGVNTLKNIRFYNNFFLRSDPKSSWALAVYCGGKGDMVGYEFRNNVIDGVYREGPIEAVHDHNVFTRPCWAGAKENGWKNGPDEIVETDLTKLFVDPAKEDWRPKPGGPLDGKGVDVGLKEDFAGQKTPPGKAPSIGAYER